MSMKANLFQSLTLIASVWPTESNIARGRCRQGGTMAG